MIDAVVHVAERGIFGILAVGAAVYAYRTVDTRLGRIAAGTALAAACYALGELMSIGPSVSVANAGTLLETIAVLPVTFGAFRVVAGVVGPDRFDWERLDPKLGALVVVLTGIVMTNPFHGLYGSVLIVQEFGGFVEPGPFLLAQYLLMFALFFCSLCLLIAAPVWGLHCDRKRYLWLLAGHCSVIVLWILTVPAQRLFLPDVGLVGTTLLSIAVVMAVLPRSGESEAEPKEAPDQGPGPSDTPKSPL